MWCERLKVGGLAAVVVSLPALALAAPAAVLRDVGPGTVDWAGEAVRVLGVAAPDVRSADVSVAPADPDRVSREDAERKLLEAVHHLPTRGAATVGDLAAADAALAKRLSDLAATPTVERVRRFSGGGTTIAARLDLDAVVAALRGTGKKAPDPVTADPPPVGLVLDATRARAFLPCLLPSVRDVDGELLAESTHEGRWRYAARVTDARTLLHAPKAPVLKATAVSDGDDTVLVLSAAVSKHLHASPDLSAALRDGPVVVVVGKPLKKKPPKPKAAK